MNIQTPAPAGPMPADAVVEQPAAPQRPAAGRFAPGTVERIWWLLRTYKLPIAAIIAASLVVGLLLTLLATPMYTASARIEISRNMDNVTEVEGVQPSDLGQDLEFYQTQYALLEARSLAERVARSLNLYRDQEFIDAFEIDMEEGAAGAEGAQRVSAAELNARVKKVTDVLLQNVSVEPVRGSSLVDLRFTSPSRTLSANIANEWTEQFIDSTMDRRFSSTREARDFLQDRLEELRTRLEESEAQLANYARDKGIVTLQEEGAGAGTTGPGITLAQTDLREINQALAQATADRVVAESEARTGSGNANEMLRNPTITGLREQRATVAAERARLLSQFEEGYPAVQSLTAQLGELDRSIAREESRVSATRSSNYQQAVDRENRLQSRVNALKGQLANQRTDSIQYNIYQREVDTNRELYNALLQRFKEIGVVEVGNNNISLVDPALPPDSPSSPILPLNMGIALLLGMLLSGTFVVAREQIDQNLRDPSDVHNILGLAHLGTVPRWREEESLETLQDRKSVTSEAYFSIATSLSFLTDHGVPRSITMTSTRPNEGKSSSVFALGVMLARMGKKVVLVEADLRNSSLHKMIDKPNERGSANFLAGEDDIPSLILHTEFEGLDVMPGGPRPPNVGELLTGQRFGVLIERLLQHYDNVLVDAPPVLGLADVPLIAPQTEGVIYTIEANGAKLGAINSALDRIRASGAHIYGAIVSKVDSRNANYGYGYGYGYGYEYHSDD